MSHTVCHNFSREEAKMAKGRESRSEVLFRVISLAKGNLTRGLKELSKRATQLRD